jgi:hypothetical protein
MWDPWLRHELWVLGPEQEPPNDPGPDEVREEWANVRRIFRDHIAPDCGVSSCAGACRWPPSALWRHLERRDLGPPKLVLDLPVWLVV